ncbi:RNA-protein complex protein Nop10 [Thermoplasma volcanium]|uniref:RNA-protein complex protein Nop10 n=1 Tax=Thermoplasma volcanium TaxID=50339 RepID=UPI0000164D72
MKSLIRKCRKCGRYTMEEICPVCGSQTYIAVPPRFSPVDRFKKYRMEELLEGKYGKNNSGKV